MDGWLNEVVMNDGDENHMNQKQKRNHFRSMEEHRVDKSITKRRQQFAIYFLFNYDVNQNGFMCR